MRRPAHECVDPRFAVLSLQGSFAEHLAALKRFPGIKAVDVRSCAELETVEALIIPGGESTAISVCLIDAGLLEPVKAFVASGRPVWGVCGALSLATAPLSHRTL